MPSARAGSSAGAATAEVTAGAGASMETLPFGTSRVQPQSPSLLAGGRGAGSVIWWDTTILPAAPLIAARPGQAVDR